MEALEEIVKNSNEEIYEVYMAGSPDYSGTVRRFLESSPSIQDIADQTEYVHDHGLRMNVLFNNSCSGGQHLTREGSSIYHWYLDKLNDMGIDAVTVADPYLVETISREFDMEVIVSCIAFIDSPEKAGFYEALGADTLTLDTNINRHFDIIESIRDATSIKLKIMVNEGCLYRCPFRYAHFNLASHRFSPGAKPNILGDYYHDRCISMRIRDPDLIIKSGWIRPEDMSEYEKIGIDLFKIAGRLRSVNWIINCMEAYSRRSYDGNLMDILDATGRLNDLFYIPNPELDGAIKRWKECKKDCYRCGFCKELTDKILRVYAGRGTKSEKLESLSAMTNGIAT
jgi:collagenase-like PrtC family protease